jgi:hypothetical protein
MLHAKKRKERFAGDISTQEGVQIPPKSTSNSQF